MNGPIARTLAGMPKHMHARAKAVALALAGEDLPLTFMENGVAVTLLRAPQMEGDLLRVDIAYATSGLRPVVLDNPYYFRNPPTGVMRDGVVVEDAIAALRAIIVGAVR